MKKKEQDRLLDGKFSCIAKPKEWCKGKTKKQIEDELWRQISSYDLHDLREFFFNALSDKEKREWVNSWHDG